MKLHHRHSFFPVVIALLTLILLVFMFLTFRKNSTSSIGHGQTVSPVSEQEYQTSLHTLMKKFTDGFPALNSQSARLSSVEGTLTSLLAFRVPFSQKDLHLSLAVQLNQMKDALHANDLTNVKASFEEIVKLTQ